jgi:hypothetical protein
VLIGGVDALAELEIFAHGSADFAGGSFGGGEGALLILDIH